MSDRKQIAECKRWVIKFGSAVLTQKNLQLNEPLIAEFIAQVAELIHQGHEVIIVSSGAVAVGVSRLGWSKRPQQVHELQAAASVGQAGLIQAYQYCLEPFGLQSGQILLSQNDMESRERYLNARTTIKTLLEHKVIPIINENDSIATEEIRFGDNDSLASYVANSIEADGLLLLTDQQGFYNKNPQLHQDAILLQLLNPADKALDEMAGAGGLIGRGGMQSKLMAARIASRSGTQTIIANGFEKNIITKVCRGDDVGSWFKVNSSNSSGFTARKRWLGARLRVKGNVSVDEGASRALSAGGSSLLPIGMNSVDGDFERGDLIHIMNSHQQVIACGLVNYDAKECRQLIKTHSSDIQSLLGYCHAEEIVHCDNLLITNS